MDSHIDPRIAIAGGGPAALTLGALLHQHNIPFTIIELRAKPTAAELDQPSGMLDLHVESGQAAIRACGLWDEFLPLTADCEESMVIADKEGTVLHADEGGLASRPEISRHNITRLMLEIVPPEAIQWNTKIVSARRDEGTGKTTLELQTGAGQNILETFDLVVGADGAWSKVRALLTDVRPEPSKLHYVTLIIKNISTRFPELAQRVGKGTYMALANGHGLASQRGAQDSAMITFFINHTDVGIDDVAKKLADLTAAELRQALLEDDRFFGEYGLKLKELANTAFDEEIKEKGAGARLDLKPLVGLPAGCQWESKSGVTLIGDAAHVMLPTAGEGVNCAMWDALDLSEVIRQAWEQAHNAQGTFKAVLDPLVRDFEEKMLTRSGEFSREAAGNAEMMFGKDGAQGMMNFMAEAFRNAPPGLETVG
ncbi:hypothetical protein N0V93_006498 [Gnomoniopsis smithogilvyi]|uniref:FAD-binding domain-containing protein n=1 Tax=Gnomoniopsis smithogilvyi TaxID=1191159 RepID=A0A9W8YQW0_9PEZI|nr:hypothetical protein N0V93_006498 [Gnomoniopsis smithogilvyi]